MKEIIMKDMKRLDKELMLCLNTLERFVKGGFPRSSYASIIERIDSIEYNLNYLAELYEKILLKKEVL